MLRISWTRDFIAMVEKLLEKLGTVDKESAVITSVKLLDDSRYTVDKKSEPRLRFSIHDTTKKWNGNKRAYPEVFRSGDMAKTARKLVRLELNVRRAKMK